MPLDLDARVTAVLGPTNTGKTHYAIERMLGHRTGVIGLPLRLLAREVYDRIVALRGPSVVALVTGEERIVPARAAYWVCTVEAMPVDLGPDFLAVDEIQLAGDPDRGHVFTDRLLNARGLSETLLLGSDTMRGRIASLIPEARFLRRERFSRLAYTGARKISRMPPRSAVVGFSVEDVYAIAELIRRQKGGAAVVMGALSPRTRNAQVDLFQNGDVDHLVATDAIGMGLNLDIAHVAFSGTAKFDGRRHRHLAPNELAQIAGRAGRYTDDGTFGVTGEAPLLDPEVVEAIESHSFAPLRKLQWRSDRLDFAAPEALIASLEAPSAHPDLVRAREADDLATLRALWDGAELGPEMKRRVRGVRDVRLLWDVCQLPDFRKVSQHDHAGLCARIYGFLHDRGGVPTDWLARQVARIDRTDGDIDALSARLAHIRTWTYVAQRQGWLDDAEHWRGETRAVEDRLSDALHARLTQRFVDRRTSVLMRRLKQRESLVAHVTDTGEVTIDGEFVGRLDGFRFRLDPSAAGEEARTLRAAGIAALAPVLNLRADKFYNAPDTEMDVTEQGGLMWGEHAVGRLTPGAEPLSPGVAPFVDEDAAPEIAEKVRRRLQHWIDRQIAARFEPLLALRGDEALAGMARGIAFRLVEALGVVPRSEIAEDVKGLEQEARASLRKHGVRFGQYSVFQPAMLKPAPTRLRLVLWSLSQGLDEFPEAPPPGLVTVPAVAGAPKGYYPRAGYRLAGDRAIRIDMLERLADILRARDARAGFEASPEMLSITGLTLEQFARLMQGLGYAATAGERPRLRPAAPAAQAAPAAATEALVGTEAGSADAATTGGTDAVPAAAGTGEAPSAADMGATAGSTGAGAPQGGRAAPGAPGETAAESDGETAGAPLPPPDGDAAPAGAGAAAESRDDALVDGAGGAAVAADDVRDAAVTGAGDAAAADGAGGAPAPADAVGEASSGAGAEAAGAAGRAEGEGADAGEREAFFVFTRPARAPRGRPQREPRPPREGAREPREGTKEAREARSRGKGRGPKGKPAGGKPAHEKTERSAAPPRSERPIDPDNPFAALMALKLRQ